MSEIVCQVGNKADQVEFIWSKDGGFFQPYVVKGPLLTELRKAADQTRVALEVLVNVLNIKQAGAEIPWEPSFNLAEAGSRLFNCLLPDEDPTAKRVFNWLEEERKQSGLIGLEIVAEERSEDPKAFLSVPWNLVYDKPPTGAAFQNARDTERWRPFWSVRYNLTSGRRVDPLKRVPLWRDPRVIVVIDPTVKKSLRDDQTQRLDSFLKELGLTSVDSMDTLKEAMAAGYPRLLYWLGHATPEYLKLGKEVIKPADLRNLLANLRVRERPEGMLAFLNACQTAEAGSGGSFLDVLDKFGFTGVIATERQTIDNFANEFGLDFLEGFLRKGKPLGELLHGLRLKSAPMGLIYGAHCPPEIRVVSSNATAAVPKPLRIRESGPVAGVALGELATRGRRKRRGDRGMQRKPSATPSLAVLDLPGEPYRSLYFYDEKDRALFTGRDADVVRFAATLDLPDTRIMILHGESGIGKSSFLRAGVIPYLEGQCFGYQFFRDAHHSLLITQAATDLVGQLAQALLDASEASLRYYTPDGEEVRVNLRQMLDKALGTTAEIATLRAAMDRDPDLLARVLERMAGRLPYALVLVLDQAEEVFTMARTVDEIACRDRGLRMLQRLVDVQADIKLIISLRTEYHGRLLDHLRAGRRDLIGVRDDLLRDFSKQALVEAIERPTLETPLAPGQPAPRQRYDFTYGEGVAAAIAKGVLDLRSENQDSVLPLVQVICTRLFDRENSDPDSDRILSLADLEAIGGVEGGLKAFAEDALGRSMGLGPEDQDAFKTIYIQLYTPQVDGTLTTRLVSRASLEKDWNRTRSFSEVLDAACKLRLLREDSLRIQGEEQQSYVRLGHDAMAKVAAAWRADRDKEEQLRRERQMETRKGRAELRLAELSSLWSAGYPNRNLPSLPDWANIRLLTRKKEWSDPQRKMMKRAGMVHGLTTLGLVVLVSLIIWGGIEGYGNLRASQLVDTLQKVDTPEVPSIVEQLPSFRRWADPRLESALQRTDHQSRPHLHVSLALLPVDASQVGYLYERLLSATPSESLVLRNALKSHQDAVTPKLWSVLESAKSGDARLLPVASALAKYDPESAKWTSVQIGKLAQALSVENPTNLGPWLVALRPVKKKLIEPVAAIFRDPRRPDNEHTSAASVLTEFAGTDARRIADLILDCRASSLEIFMKQIEATPHVVDYLREFLKKRATYEWKDTADERPWPQPDLKTLQKRFESGSGIVNDRFAFCQTMLLDEFLEVAKQMKPSGYRPTRLRPYRDGSIVRVAAVWERDNRGWEFAVSMTKEEILEKNRAMRSRSFVPVDVAGYVAVDDKGRPLDRYAALWADTKGQRSDRYAARWDVTDDQAELIVGLGIAKYETEHKRLRIEGLLSLDTSHVFINADGLEIRSGVYRMPRDPTSTGDEPTVWGNTQKDLDRSNQVFARSNLSEVSPYAHRIYPPQNPEKAFARSDRLLKASPDDWSARRARAFAAFRLGRNQEALDDIEQCMKEKPDQNDLSFYRPVLHARLRREPEAQSELAEFQKSKGIGSAQAL
jgi:Tetratricopeptide repeat/AAA ATPase domain/Bacterial tandem repeat domain 1